MVKKIIVILILSLSFCCHSVLADQKLHTIGFYEAPSVGAGPIVLVQKTKEPVTLVLSSYSKTQWTIYLDQGASLNRVIVNGYEPSTASITGLNYSDADVPIDYRFDEKICWPGDSRSELDNVSLGVFPDRQKKIQQMDRFYDSLERETGIVADRDSSVFKNSYTGFLDYIVKDDKIKGKGKGKGKGKKKI